MSKTQSEINIDDLPWRVIITWSAGYSPVVTGVEIRALRADDGRRGEVDAATWRAVPIGQLIAANRPQPNPSQVIYRSPTGRPRVLGEDHYRDVASIYRTALAAGVPPVQAVSAHFDVADSVARRWVHVARNRHGLLPRVRRGQAG